MCVFKGGVLMKDRLSTVYEDKCRWEEEFLNVLSISSLWLLLLFFSDWKHEVQRPEAENYEWNS